MNRTLGIVFILFVACAATQGQTGRPAATPTPSDDVVRISTNIIQLDVSVTDQKGKSISDLKQDEVEIYENGQKQRITGFSFVSSVRGETPTAATPPTKTDVPAPPVITRPDSIRRTIALVVDDLALSFESAYYTRRALRKFVDSQMQDGDLVAIIRTGAGIGALQQFTSDKRILYAAIERVKWNPLGGSGISAFAPIEPTPLEVAAANGDVTVSEEDLADERNRNNSINDFRGSVFATGTLGALRYIVNGMADLPGRKSVILLSEGFRLEQRDEHGFRTTGGVMDFLRQLVDEANRRSVVFYTIDPRGLQVAGIDAADNTGELSPEAINQRASDRREELSETQAGLDYLAQETGGISIKNNNDISGGVRRILDDQSYYLIAYEPDSDTFDPRIRKYNRIEIKVLRSGARTRYRSGFFNVADKEDNTAKAAVGTPAQQLQAALVSPFAVGGVTLRLNALFGNDPRSGSYVRSLLHVDASDLKFVDGPNGTKRAEFDILAVSFGDNGQMVDQIGKSYALTVKPENVKYLTDNGFIYSFVFPVKKPGPYQYRVAVRDVNGGKAGSASQFIEIPDLKKGGLTLSGMILESLSAQQWRQMSDATARMPITDPMTDTATRRIKPGTVLRYGYEIYNAKLDPSRRPQLTARIRVFRDGKLVLDGKGAEVSFDGQADLGRIRVSGALSIGSAMEPGEYILQVIVTDALAKVKRQIAAQFVQFEVVP